MQRASALSEMLERAVTVQVDAIWIGRDLGYRGGRRTGLALTDDVHLARHARRWSLNVSRPTHGAVMMERTAALAWRLLDRIDRHTFLWNVFPLHPHEAGKPLSNRLHDARERRSGEEALAELISLLKPERLIAIGNDAAASVGRMGGTIPVERVRHPSYGGQTDFLRSMHQLYDLDQRGPLI
jgi:uracil-DNA glycosylase